MLDCHVVAVGDKNVPVFLVRMEDLLFAMGERACLEFQRRTTTVFCFAEVAVKNIYSSDCPRKTKLISYENYCLLRI